MSRPLANRGFLSLLLTQFCGAANDNVLKQVLTFMIATGIWSRSVEDGGLGEGGQVVPALMLAVPFILLSGFAGQVADRHSKRSVMLVVKIVEIPIAAIAMIGFLTQSLVVTLAAMLLLAIQSSFFGPAKYGVIPEIVHEGELSRANGLLNMLTNIAVIGGSLVAGPLSDMYDPRKSDADPILWAPGAGLLAIAVLGFGAILLMPRLTASDPTLKYDYNPFSTYVRSLRKMAGTPLITVALAWAFFYMIGMMALLIIPEYQAILDVTYQRTSVLIGILGLAIGVGSVLAGLISGHHIKPRLVPIGALGMTVAFVLLGVLPATFWSVAVLLLVAGTFAGFYIIPLQALLQRLSPEDERGQFLGTANGLSFTFITLGCGIYWVCTNRLAMQANHVFLVCGALAAVGTGALLLRMRRYLREHRSV